MQQPHQKFIIERLQRQILDLEGFKAEPEHSKTKLGLNNLERNFPNQVFPTGTIHEFVSEKPEYTACTSAFISILLAKLNTSGGVYVWIGKQRQLFPAGLKNFGIQPHQIIFINLVKQKDILWATEEALKCKSLSGVISELETITFAQSQRLQLTVEKSKVTGFILRTQTEHISATACAARWQISPIASQNEDNLPGLGFATWQVNLLKVRNGSTTSCNMSYQHGELTILEPKKYQAFKQRRAIS